jgi:hypothetical protein
VAKKFYRNLFDWKLEDAPGMEYTMIDGGGMMRNSLPGVHSFLLPYVLAPEFSAS